MRAWALAIWLALLVIAVPAFAQSAQPLPPVHSTVDANGVDLVSGQFSYAKTDISIGPAEAGGLAYTRTYVSGQWFDNVEITFNQRAEVADPIYVITFGMTSESFDAEGSSLQGNGSSLTVPGGGDYWIYNRADGLKIFFIQRGTSCDVHAPCGLATSIVYPTGEKQFYTYQSASYCTDPSECPGTTTTAYRLMSINSSFGYQLKFEYSSNTAPTSATIDAWQRKTKVTAINGAVEYCDPSSNSCTLTGSWPSATYAYSTTSGHDLITVTDAASRATVYTMNSGALIGIRSPGYSSDNLIISYGTGGVSSVSNGTNSWSYSYSTASGVLTTTVTDPLGHTRVLTSQDQIARTDTNGVGKIWTYTPDSYGRIISVIAPEGNHVDYTFDARGNTTQTKVVAKSGSGVADIVTTAGYDTTCTNAVTCNQPNWTQDARGNQTDYTYNSTFGAVLTIEAPAPYTGAARPKTTIAYAQYHAWLKNALGGIDESAVAAYLPVSTKACMTGSSCADTSTETVREIGYGTGSSSVATNRLPATITSRDGSSTLVSTVTLAYDTIGNTITVDGPISGTDDTTTFRFDAVRALTGIIRADPDGSGSRPRPAERRTYDSYGRLASVDTGTVNGTTDTDWAAFSVYQTTTQTYDSLGRPVVAALSSGSTTYAVTQSTYDAANRLDCTAVRMNDAAFGSSLPSSACTLGTTSSYGPDRITHNTYSNADQLLSTIEAYGVTGAARTTSTTYTDNGLAATLTDARGNKTTYEYDGVDRLSKLRYPDPATAGTSSTTDYEQRGYDATSNVTSLRTRSADTIGLTYDNLNRMTVKDLPGGTAEDVYASYDNLGHLTSALYASTSGSGVTQAWDALGRMTSQSTFGRTLSYQYDLAGNRTRLTWPSAEWVGYSYDALYELTAMSEAGSSLLTFGYDALGRRTSIGRANGVTTSYTYDAVSRLDTLIHNLTGSTGDYSSALAYTPASQMRARTQANDAAYAWKGSANQSIGYTPNGLNQIASIQGINFGYDANGNLTRGAASYTYDAENKLRSASAPTPVTLAYDPLGRLSQTTSTTTAQLLYDGNDLVAEYDAGGTLTRRYVHGPGTDEPLVQYAPTTRSWMYADERGSIVSTSDDSGNLIAANGYSPSGQPDSWSMSRFGYTGQIAIPEAMLWHYKARAYAPRLGRFLQTDPIGVAGGINLYAYAAGDPINRNDPSGLDPTAGVDLSVILRALERTRAQGEPQRREYAFTIHSIWSFPPFTLGETRGDAQSVVIPCNLGCAVIGHYHTEAGGAPHYSEKLSDDRYADGGPSDIHTSEDFGVPIWLITPSTAIKAYDPGSNSLYTLTNSNGSEFHLNSINGNITSTSKNRDGSYTVNYQSQNGGNGVHRITVNVRKTGECTKNQKGEYICPD